MGVYIPNMEKPKNGKEIWFDVWNETSLTSHGIIGIEDLIEIDLVRCGECRHWNYVCEDEMFGMKYGECRFYKWLDGCNQGKEMLSTDFCSRGERRAE